MRDTTDGNRRRPVMQPNRLLTKLGNLISMTWNYVCVKRSFYIAQDFVIDSLGDRGLQDGVAQTRHVFQELRPRGSGQGIQVDDNGIGQQQAVAASDLRIAEDCPTGRQSRDYTVQGAGARRFDLFMDRRQRMAHQG